jgi:hypothetical protein
MLTTGTTITTVGHYKDAAERHLQVCTILFKQLDYHQNFRNTNKFQNILAELYYLSGYIVECVVNYKYLDHKGFNDIDNHNQRTRWHSNVDLHKHFRFTDSRARISSEQILSELASSSLPDYLKSFGAVPSMTLIGQEIIKEKMQRHWDPRVRYAYESTGLLFTSSSVDEIKIYYKAAKDLYNDLI